VRKMASELNKWEVRGKNGDGETVVLNWGESELSFPNAEMRKIIRSHGHKIYVNGQLYKEPECVKK